MKTVKLAETYQAVTKARPDLVVSDEGVVLQFNNLDRAEWVWLDGRKAPEYIPGGVAMGLIVLHWLESLPPLHGIMQGNRSDRRCWYVDGISETWQRADSPIEALASFFLNSQVHTKTI